MRKIYTYEDIINNTNLIFDLKQDIIFRNVFLNECSHDYVCRLFNCLLGYDLEDLKNNLRLVNNEHSSNSVHGNIIRSDIIYEYRDVYIIFEMNMSDKEFHINKNYQYLFKQHSSRLNNKNKYKKKTILINIDNYDVGDVNDLVYDSKIYISKYYKNIYNYINIFHINLDSLKEKIYNKDELSLVDKLLLIFVEQDKRNLIGKVEKEVKEIMDYMSRLDFKEGDPVTYNYIEAEKVRKEMAIIHEREMKEYEQEVKVQEQAVKEQEQQVKEQEQQVKEQEQQVKEQEQQVKEQKLNLQKYEQELEQDKNKLHEEKITLAKELKKIGFSKEKILKITKLSDNIITML